MAEFNIGFQKSNHYKTVSYENGVATVEAEIKEDSLNPLGIPHGGFIFGLGDTAMGCAVFANGRNAVTINSNIYYLKVGKEKKLRAEAKITKDGKKVCFTEAKIFSGENLIATMTGNYYYVD